PSETKPAAVEKPAPPVAKPAEKPVEKVAEKPATPVPPKPAVTSATGLPAELTVPVESSKGGSCIVVGSGESRKESEMIATPYIAKGLAVSFATAEVGGSTRHRVRVGQFASTAAASKAIKEYASLFPKGAFVVRVK
ncbi:MAG: SPOR domain-containing protein, partial [Rhizobacter sp.]|nr:SPOR domain-containing protein [Chlorobiales bacterium]